MATYHILNHLEDIQKTVNVSSIEELEDIIFELKDYHGHYAKFTYVEVTPEEFVAQFDEEDFPMILAAVQVLGTEGFSDSKVLAQNKFALAMLKAFGGNEIGNEKGKEILLAYNKGFNSGREKARLKFREEKGITV